MDRPGFRTRELTVITTLLDAGLYPAQERLTAYLKRVRGGSIFAISQYAQNVLAVRMICEDYSDPTNRIKLTGELLRSELPLYGFGENKTNFVTGESIREEDSPGNYVIREMDGKMKYFWYDINGAEHAAF